MSSARTKRGSPPIRRGAQTITIVIGINPPGTGTLSGTLTRKTDPSGTATFNDLKIDWLGTGYTLAASANPASGSVSGPSTAFNELRVGDPCLGPIPSCSSGCADRDNDGLNDAWEIAGGIDLNGDGVITDSYHDLLVPGADPNKPDVYLKYDYMVASTAPPDGMPPHSHQPPDAAIQQVVDSFAAHGITLHIDPQHDAIPEVFVTTLDPNPTIACAANGTSGGGYTFVTMHTLRQRYFGNRKWAYHYPVFAHSHTVPDTAPCCDPASCAPQACNSCPTDALCGGHPDPSSSGASEVNGSSFILALGTLAANVGISPGSIGVETYASVFMHELGHNFGLVHGSLAPSVDPVLTTAQQACLAWKPNYLSVMDYRYYQNGISVAAQPSSITPRHCNVDGDCPVGAHCTNDLDGPAGGNVCYRIDYSNQTLLTLNEASLNETLGVGGAAGQTDIASYCSALSCGLQGPSFGPIDWNHDGAIETNVQADVDGNPLGAPTRILSTTSDWDKMNFKFQCSTAFAQDLCAGAPAQVQSSIFTPELGLREASRRHVLYPPAAVSLLVNPVCFNPGLRPRTPGAAQVALLGSSTFDASQVDQLSLSLHGASPVNISLQDVNNDGIPDLLLEFRGSDVGISPRAMRVRLTGWLKNSRSFVGEAQLAAACSQ
jgi:hypothetical protein